VALLAVVVPATAQYDDGLHCMHDIGPAEDVGSLKIAMPRFGSTQFAFPDFSGATRRLVLWNLGGYFILLVAGVAWPETARWLVDHAALRPDMFFAGRIWQPITYSLVHLSLIGTLFELLSLWFLGGFLEPMHGGRWLNGLYAVSVLGAAITAILIFEITWHVGSPQPLVVISGCLGGIFGMMTAIALLHGDVQFQLFFVIGIKAKYLAMIYTLIALAETFGEQRIYAFAQLGGALAALVYVRYAPRRGFGFKVSESWYGLRNKYYRWKRRRAASKFQVYMKKQGRTVRFDGQGRLIDEDSEHDDHKRWN
jgi:membrane associated rhomboid family serine protease